jgi:rare lipoprotein A (peptidoglycan hydrolase)
VTFFTSINVVLIAIIALLLSCSSSPRYNRNTQVIPQQETEKTIKKPPVADDLQILSENNTQENIVSNNADTTTPTSAEAIISKGNDTVYSFYQQGIATYYADKFQGHKTAFGERYDIKQYTAAHRTLPHNSLVRVTALSNNKSVIVRINDRGPFTRNRVIDLSKAAAKEIDLVAHGLMKVTIETIEVK